MKSLLKETKFKQYETLFFIKFKEEAMISDLAQIVRALPYVAVVNNKTDKEEKRPQGLFAVKVVTSKPPIETFEAVKEMALTQIPEITAFKYSNKHIEAKDI